jgi:phosphate transport system substrate-binding protein
MPTKQIVVVLSVLALMTGLHSCSDYFTNDYRDNSPTSGLLNVYFDEGTRLHVQNQAATFASQYPNAKLNLFETSESAAVEALLNDSCELIVIARPLSASEKKVFAQKTFTPNYSAVAKSGVAVIANAECSLRSIELNALRDYLKGDRQLTDSTGAGINLNVLFDKNNSSVLHYMVDSICNGAKLTTSAGILEGSLETINYVATHKNTIGLIDFCWLSDVDDSIYKANKNLIKILPVGNGDGKFYYPDQSNFKLGLYPLARTIYVYRKVGDFTLAKGFESFIAGPKGQLIFQKQGLMPCRQGERRVHINAGQAPGSEN